MPVINGVKYACEPCMRGHRSSKCTHGDRILVRVRKPGRPLSSCPHSVGDCHCGGVRVAIPRVSSCACGPTSSIAEANGSFPVASDAYIHQGQQVLVSQEPPSSNEMQKAKRRKSSVLQVPLGVSLEAKDETSAYDSVNLSSIPDRFSPSTSSDPGFIGEGIQAVFDLDSLGSAKGNQTDTTSAQYHLNNAGDSGLMNPTTTSSECCVHSSNVAQSLPTTSGQGRSRSASTLTNPSSNGQRKGQNLSPDEGIELKENASILHGNVPQANLPEAYRHASGGKRLHDPGSGQSASKTCCSSTATGKGVKAQQAAPRMKPSCCGNPGRLQPPVYHNESRTVPSSHNNQSYGMDKAILSLQSQQLQAQQQMPFQPPVFPLFSCQNPSFQPPPLTTMYTFPPTYSTFQRPLKPQELAFLHSSPQLWAQSVPHVVTAGVFGEMAPAAAGATPLLAHNCNCGDGCNCLGCAAHPYNGATLNFVRSLRDIMGADGDPRHHKRSSQDGQLPAAITKNSGCCGGGGASTHLQGTMSRPHPEVYDTVTDSSQRVSIGQPLASPTGPSLPILPSRVLTKPASPPLWPKIGESDMENEEVESISPSAYFHVDYPIGGCAEEKDGCLCGEGCTCVGCLTHGGHDGVALAEFPSGNLVNDGTVDRGPQQIDLTKQYSSIDGDGQSFAFMPSLIDHGGY